MGWGGGNGRRYRTGYVWQDVADDDLITPVSDNEYVLKGSLTTTAGAAPTVSYSSSSTVFCSPSAATSAAAVYVISPLAGKESGSQSLVATAIFISRLRIVQFNY